MRALCSGRWDTGATQFAFCNLHGNMLDMCGKLSPGSIVLHVGIPGETSGLDGYLPRAG